MKIFNGMSKTHVPGTERVELRVCTKSGCTPDGSEALFGSIGYGARRRGSQGRHLMTTESH